MPARVSAWVFLGAWFLYELIEANFGMFSAPANGGGVAFFAHVGGFMYGFVVAWWPHGRGWIGVRTDITAPVAFRHDNW